MRACVTALQSLRAARERVLGNRGMGQDVLRAAPRWSADELAAAAHSRFPLRTDSLPCNLPYKCSCRGVRGDDIYVGERDRCYADRPVVLG